MLSLLFFRECVAGVAGEDEEASAMVFPLSHNDIRRESPGDFCSKFIVDMVLNLNPRERTDSGE
jgi:hypothetical protein